jgi:hypothetical protein
LGEYSDLLKNMLGNINGYMDVLGIKTKNNNVCSIESGIKEKLMSSKLGYFILIALKGE